MMPICISRPHAETHFLRERYYPQTSHSPKLVNRAVLSTCSRKPLRRGRIRRLPRRLVQNTAFRRLCFSIWCRPTRNTADVQDLHPRPNHMNVLINSSSATNRHVLLLTPTFDADRGVEDSPTHRWSLQLSIATSIGSHCTGSRNQQFPF